MPAPARRSQCCDAVAGIFLACSALIAVPMSRAFTLVPALGRVPVIGAPGRMRCEGALVCTRSAGTQIAMNGVHNDDAKQHSEVESNNEAMEMLQWRLAAASSRRKALQVGVAGFTAGMLAEQAFLHVLHPAPVYAVDGPLLRTQYDLGLEKFHKAPGRKIVYPDYTVEKSPADTRSYRALTLRNGLRVLLASDSKAEQAAAALNVHVGHFSDPPDVAGLAHFCEHMLFLGNAKYPVEGDLDAFLSQHGGSSNAFTASEDTCYFFNINQEQLRPALDRFSQFFVAPLFTEAATDREVNAIDAENAKNLQQDSWRLDQLQKMRANPRHPYSKFGTGNRNTLKDMPNKKGIEAREELLKFYKQYYSANLMTLAVVGRDDLDTLESWVTDLFSVVGNSDVPPPETAWAGKVPVLSDSAAKRVVNAVPISDDRFIQLNWLLPFTSEADRQMKLRGKPEFVACFLLGYEGKGSLVSYLKDLGLIEGLGAAIAEQTSDCQILEISVDITERGLAQRDDVIEAIFSYINMVKNEGVPPYILEEAEAMSTVSWSFRENSEPGEVASTFASNMQEYPPELYLSGPARLRGLNGKDVQDIYAKLTPEAALVTVVSQGFTSAAKDTEKWYKTRYFTEKLPASVLKRWEAAPRIQGITFPSPNPLIPSDLSIKAPAIEDQSVFPEGPTLICDEPKWRVHYKQDRRYGQPKGYAYFNIKMPRTLFGADATARTSALSRLYKMSLGDAVNEYIYDASVAGLGASLEFGSKAIRITFSGFNDKLRPFVAQTAAMLASHRPTDESKISRFRDSIARDIKGFNSSQPYQHASFFASLYTSKPAFLPADVLRELETVTLGDVQAFGDELWASAFGEVLVQGNMLEEDARGIVDSMDQALNFTELKRADQAVSTLYQLPLTPHGHGSLVRSVEPNAADPNSAAVVYLQNSDRSDLRQQMAMEVLASIVEAPFYGDLRTKQQLGYIVSSGIKEERGVRSLVFTVQSGFADAGYLSEKVFAFLGGFEKTLRRMDDAEVNGYIKSLVETKEQKIVRLSDETLLHWGEIVTGKYKYDRTLVEAKTTKELNKAFLVKVWQDVIASGGSRRRVLTSEVLRFRVCVSWQEVRAG